MDKHTEEECAEDLLNCDQTKLMMAEIQNKVKAALKK
jgi:hypothetical protein